MARQFTLPDLGEGVSEGQVLRLLVAEGDRVEEDQLLMEVETDKAAVEIPSPHTGTIARWHVSERQTVNVGDVLVTFGDVGSATGTDPARPRSPSHADGAGTTRPAAPVPSPAPARPGSRTRTPASPAVRTLARTRGVDIDAIAGSGPGGRVTRADVEQAASPDRGPVPGPAPAPVSAQGTAGRLVEPSGAEGTDAHGPVRREPLSKMRRAIATTMSKAAATIPHVTDSDDADVTDLDRLRRGYNESVPADDKTGRIGLLPFVIRAVVRALQANPIVNASYDEERQEIVYKRYFNIAVGVQTDRGLVAPVLAGVDRMSVPEIDSALREMIDRARKGSVTLESMRGATYTISNAGALGGSRYSTPIITPPQVAVLAVGRSRLQPWVVDGRVVPRLIMPLSHSMDHRVIDGALEIAFMKHLIGDLENPGRLLL